MIGRLRPDESRHEVGTPTRLSVCERTTRWDTCTNRRQTQHHDTLPIYQMELVLYASEVVRRGQSRHLMYESSSVSSPLLTSKFQAFYNLTDSQTHKSATFFSSTSPLTQRKHVRFAAWVSCPLLHRQQIGPPPRQLSCRSEVGLPYNRRSLYVAITSLESCCGLPCRPHRPSSLRSWRLGPLFTAWVVAD